MSQNTPSNTFVVSTPNTKRATVKEMKDGQKSAVYGALKSIVRSVMECQELPAFDIPELQTTVDSITVIHAGSTFSHGEIVYTVAVDITREVMAQVDTLAKLTGGLVKVDGKKDSPVKGVKKVYTL